MSPQNLYLQVEINTGNSSLGIGFVSENVKLKSSLQIFVILGMFSSGTTTDSKIKKKINLTLKQNQPSLVNNGAVALY